MIFISRIKLRNFKSFKFIDVPLPRTFLCLAGPNGSGKSNFTDGIRFVMGETSLKSLRAKKVRDLITGGAKAAEVTITFESDPNDKGKKEKFEIKRAIREDGKIRYRLNDHTTTRTAIMDALKKYNLDGSGRNIIVQGEVQRIIGMPGKERRTIIDSVAGISDFDEKKKEAMKELDIVDGRIKEAHLVLGERTSFLAELEREREIAIKYVDTKTRLTNAKGTLLKVEAERLEKEFEDVTKTLSKYQYSLSNKEQELAEFDAKAKNLETHRSNTNKELQLRQQTSALVKKIEELKAAIAAKHQMVEDKEASLKKSGEDAVSIKKDIDEEKPKLVAIEKEFISLKKELEKYESELAVLRPASEDSSILTARTALKESELKLQDIKEQLIKIEMEIKSKQEIVQIRSNELSAIGPNKENDEDEETRKDIIRLKKEAQSVANEIDEQFKKTKETNMDMVDLDKKFLELREKSSYLRVRVSPSLGNPALKFIADLKAKNSVPGIHGTVAELIKFENKHATAVEAAAGNRLLYVVVDDADVATKIIERLKKANAGRATFIPLREVKVSSGNAPKSAEQLVSFVSYDLEVKRAVEFVFGDTLLIDDPDHAKKIGVGTARMVTLGGDLYERVGTITGGKTESSILATAQLRKIDEEAESIKQSKESMMRELYAIRERESELRSAKSEIEVQIKSCEMKLVFRDEERQKNEQELKRKEDVTAEIEQIKVTIKSLVQEQEKLNSEFNSLEKKVAQMQHNLSQSEAKDKQLSEAAQKRETELASLISSLRATISGKNNEFALRKKELHIREDKISQMEKEKSEMIEKITSLKRQTINDQKELEIQESQIHKYSKEIESLFEEMKKFDSELQEIGKEIGIRRFEIDKINKELNQANIKKATVETRLTDVKAEFESYKTAEFLDLKRDELSAIIKESEILIESLGNVNMAAIDMYVKKKAEIEDIQERLNKLSEEHSAVVEMINEIEQRKKEAFFETFNAVSDNFRRMFKHINIGEGYLYLDKPNEPFESGLFIKLKRHNREHVLDSLSGGESSLVALMFIFALQFFKPAPFYILDEVDAALDKENSRNLALLIKQMSSDTQFLMISHNDTVMSTAEAVLGVTKVDGVSKLVGVKLEQAQVA
ncbi:MAG: AAA family ATPase [Candidatus Micrarchaeota archaeon]|nr:AAA family ATPase [Candidatus Micrarchaeota archaeon]